MAQLDAAYLAVALDVMIGLQYCYDLHVAGLGIRKVSLDLTMRVVVCMAYSQVPLLGILTGAVVEPAIPVLMCRYWCIGRVPVKAMTIVTLPGAKLSKEGVES